MRRTSALTLGSAIKIYQPGNNGNALDATDASNGSNMNYFGTSRVVDTRPLPGPGVAISCDIYPFSTSSQSFTLFTVGPGDQIKSVSNTFSVTRSGTTSVKNISLTGLNWLAGYRLGIVSSVNQVPGRNVPGESYGVGTLTGGTTAVNEYINFSEYIYDYLFPIKLKYT